MGDGTSIRFWTDLWVGDTPLVELASIPHSHMIASEVVADYISENRWNVDKLMEVLPIATIQKIKNVHIGVDSLLQDSGTLFQRVVLCDPRLFIML